MKFLFVKLALRNIFRNRLYSLINIIGLSIGIATTLYIFLFIRTESRYDSFYPEGKHLFRIVETWKLKNDNISSGYANYPFAPESAASIPGIRDYCRVSATWEVKFFKKSQIFKIEKLRFVDENFFSFFKIRLVAGNPVMVLNSADKLVLSQRTATRIFGSEDPLGQQIIYNQKVFTVSGISADMPQNTHLKYDVLLSNRYVENDKENIHLGWDGGMTFLSYLKLTPGVQFEKVEAAFPAFLYEKINRKIEGSGAAVSAKLQNIRNIHISDRAINYDCPDNRSRNSLLTVSGIGLLILILALINYISLYVSQKNEKIRSIILLSVHGAGRRQLIIQTYIEVLIMSFISSLAGIFLFSLLSPWLNNFLKTSVVSGENLISSLLLLVIICLGISLIITIFSSLDRSRFNITELIKGGGLPEKSRKNILSTGLVTVQFIIVIIFIVSVLVMNKQNKYVNNKEYGFDKENIFSVFSDKEFKHNELSVFKQELFNIPGIRNVSLSSQGVGRGLTMNGYRFTGEDQVTMLNVIYTDADFLDCFGINLLSGRNFKPDPKQDLNSILVNQKLVKRASWKDPLNQTIDRNGRMTVIGIVNDFNFASLYSEIKPLIIMCNPAYDGWGYSCINIRFQTSDIKALIDRIRHLWEKDYPGTTYEIAFLTDQLSENYKSLTDQQKIVSFFSVFSVLIACMGLFGLASFLARRRTKEIGIRRINGARVSEIIMMLNISFLRWIIWSVIIAVPLGWYAMNKWLQNFAYRIIPAWWVFGLACLIVLFIAFLTVSWQSVRAATCNPAETLRYE